MVLCEFIVNHREALVARRSPSGWLRSPPNESSMHEESYNGWRLPRHFERG
jgi:hypothetical protein